jgi:hypothetical protein
MLPCRIISLVTESLKNFVVQISHLHLALTRSFPHHGASTGHLIYPLFLKLAFAVSTKYPVKLKWYKQVLGALIVK